MLSAPTQESVALVKELGIMNGEAMPQPVDEKKESPSADGYIPHEIPIHGQGIPPMMNGMPPSQVYVDTTMGYRGMNVIESQFQVMGISDAHDTNNFEDSEGNDATGEGSNEDDPVKLFIGQVSKICSPNVGCSDSLLLFSSSMKNQHRPVPVPHIIFFAITPRSPKQ